MKNLSTLFFLLLCANVLTSCDSKEDNNTVPSDPNLGSLILDFAHTYQASPFILNKKYATSLGDTFNVEDLAYYMSNIVLTKDNDENYVVPNSYHLIRQTNKFGQKNRLQIKLNVPAGNYKAIKMSVGVDSARNFRIDQVGELDPNSFMAWDWNIGYKYFLMEGRVFHPDSINPIGLVYHLGNLSNYRTREFELPTLVEIKAGNNTNLNLTLEVDKVFSGPNELDIKTVFNEMGGPRTGLIADNVISAYKLQIPASSLQ